MNGKAMEKLRKKHGIKRSAFARWAGYSYSAVYRWEREPDYAVPERGYKLLKAYIKEFRQEADHEHQAS